MSTRHWFRRIFRRYSKIELTAFAFLAFMTWLSPFALLNALLAGAAIIIDEMLPHPLRRRAWIVKPLQLLFVALSVLAGLAALVTLPRASFDSFGVLGILAATGACSLLGLLVVLFGKIDGTKIPDRIEDPYVPVGYLSRLDYLVDRDVVNPGLIGEAAYTGWDRDEH
jgi:hypothetical protein